MTARKTKAPAKGKSQPAIVEVAAHSYDKPSAPVHIPRAILHALDDAIDMAYALELIARGGHTENPSHQRGHLQVVYRHIEGLEVLANDIDRLRGLPRGQP